MHRASFVLVPLACSLAIATLAPPHQSRSPFQSRRPESRGPEKGVLLIAGGGGKKGREKGQEIFRRFIDLARETSTKKSPRIVVIATAQGKKIDKKTVDEHKAVVRFRELMGQAQANVVGLHTLSRKEANAKWFTSVIDAADAVWMTGGKQYHLAKTFVGTQTEKALRRLLGRGGVIGGSSAGAQIQSSFMTRGALRHSRMLGNGKTQTGFGFITNSAFDVHVSARKRNKDLFKFFAARAGTLADATVDPMEFLGIGIDENAAIVVRKDRFEVIGANRVFVFDPRKWKKGIDPFFETLSSGDVYDLRERIVVKPETQKAPVKKSEGEGDNPEFP